MRYISYKTSGTCSKEIKISLDSDNIIRKLDFLKGCDGNLKAVSALCIEKKAKDVSTLLEDITCNRKNTSCPDQLSKALKGIM